MGRVNDRPVPEWLLGPHLSKIQRLFSINKYTTVRNIGKNEIQLRNFDQLQPAHSNAKLKQTLLSGLHAGQLKITNF